MQLHHHQHRPDPEDLVVIREGCVSLRLEPAHHRLLRAAHKRTPHRITPEDKIAVKITMLIVSEKVPLQRQYGMGLQLTCSECQLQRPGRSHLSI